MKVKKGDTVVVIAGKDRGKSGTIVRVYPKKDQVLVEGVNMAKKHEKARRAGQRGQILERAVPVHVSNVALKDPKSGKPTRLKMVIDGEKKTRTAVKSGAKV